MALIPSRVKYRKQQRGNRAGIASRGNYLAFGTYGLMAMERCWMDTRQLEAARVAVTRAMKRHGRVWLRVFPDKPVTKKPLEVRQGTGKGAVDTWVAVIRPANILMEVEGITETQAREAFRLAACKLPIRTKFIGRHRAANA